MSLDFLSINWFDIVVIGLLGVGLVQGRKKGMSSELLDVFQWLLIVVFAALLYRPIGLFISKPLGFNHQWSFVIAYLAVAVAIKLMFLMIKKHVGEKLVGSDIFGRTEYYLGMGAGMLRCSCMIVAAVALIHAHLFTSSQVAAQMAKQTRELGAPFFPTAGKLQQDVLQKSLSGQFIKKHLGDQLITSARPSAKPREAIARQRERIVEAVMMESWNN